MVTLDRFRPGDIPAVYDAMQDWQVVRWLKVVPWPYRMADAEVFVKEIADVETHAIRLGGRLVGAIHCGADLGYWLARDYWGQGIMPRAARQVLAAHFASGGGAVEASYHIGNARSAGVLHRLGFTETGRVRYFSRPRQQEIDAITLRLTPDAYGLQQPWVIDTARTRIEPMTATDAPALRAIVTRPETGRMLFIFPPDLSDAGAAAIIEENRWRGGRPVRLAIRQDGRFIGSIGIGSGDEPSIFYFLAPEVSGQGLASEVVAGFTRAALKRFGLKAIRAEVFTDNPASARVLEKAGFRQTGVEMLTSAQRAAPAPGWIYRLTSSADAPRTTVPDTGGSAPQDRR